ncbi:MAG: hypothetical protein EA401_11130 [Planctomycetota bacterium]|nr:MAG: hypothetical protein EA401_11130 [Planctomycetota bacterium]
MRMSSDPSRLNEVVRDFNRLWHSCGEGWQDDSREHFQRHHIDDIQHACDDLLAHLAQFNHILSSAIQRCQ